MARVDRRLMAVEGQGDTTGQAARLPEPDRKATQRMGVTLPNVSSLSSTVVALRHATNRCETMADYSKLVRSQMDGPGVPCPPDLLASVLGLPPKPK